MTRAQFLNDLYHRLEGLTQEQAEQHLTYYAEMLADRMEEGMSEEQAVESMEDVETIARRILEEEGRSVLPAAGAPRVPGRLPHPRRRGRESLSGQGKAGLAQAGQHPPLGSGHPVRTGGPGAVDCPGSLGVPGCGYHGCGAGGYRPEPGI